MWELIEQTPGGITRCVIAAGADRAELLWLASMTVPRYRNRIVVRRAV